ncbi:hypothetical protein NESM_000567000 [Novymonas esmeraldas]|uniref:Uncharacterized protein n=1 Tax=Novymonas esmeraldas TaxID=1808958 RepID=A0AAW0ESB7_9TRYP
MQFTADTDASSPFSGGGGGDGVFSVSVDAMHGRDTALFNVLGAVAEDEEPENSNDVLLRLLNEVRAVDSDAGDLDEAELLDGGADETAAAGAIFSVTDGEAMRSYAPPYMPGLHSGGAAMIGAVAGGFTVEGNASYSSATSLPLPPPPPPPPPPAYGTPSVAPRSPYTNCYTAIPHLSSTPGSKPPPPSFAEAMANAHGTPASLIGRPAPSQECSPVLANYVPSMPAAPQETVLLRNSNGVFLLHPISKPTPPYTPPAGGMSPPVSPLPRYSLPPAAAATLTSSATNTFLGSSVAQVCVRGASIADPPHYGSFGHGGSSPYLGTAPPYSRGIGSLRGTPSFGAAPPPYTAGVGPRGGLPTR